MGLLGPKTGFSEKSLLREPANRPRMELRGPTSGPRTWDCQGNDLGTSPPEGRLIRFRGGTVTLHLGSPEADVQAARLPDCDSYDMTFLDEAQMRMIRTDQWKLVLYFDKDGRDGLDGKRHELFNLGEDPGELDNLYGKQSVQPIQQELETRLRAWMREASL